MPEPVTGIRRVSGTGASRERRTQVVENPNHQFSVSGGRIALQRWFYEKVTMNHQKTSRFSMSDLKKKVRAGIGKDGDRGGQWR
ncbi:hypothetical protein E3N88_34767 [Mikania micrantha]|uniref:Uncharacterized protein n=1 Tax=Mikania micrantha TaxID=192012 RepID=A0A5N6LZ33_9ASTR|nr:hypothetical protein E3N88_34767 [Mikania micrantha]